MREIKFKAWDKINKKIVKTERIDFLMEEAIVCTPLKTRYLIPLYNLDFMQYVGIKDKNGVEIYEGYIILSNNKKYKIDYDKRCACYKAYLISPPTNKDDINEMTICATGNLDKNIYIEVIGNIYEYGETKCL